MCPFSTQVLLFLVVLFILLLCMASSSVLSVAFTVFLYAFFDKALRLNGFVLSTVSYHSFLLMVFFPDVGDMCHSMWQGGFTRNRKQEVNRLKIPQGLSTLLFHRWSEVPSRGGVRGDSP